ncbi:MAG: hypothetical protein CR986_10605 [Ignavibacteriae bacterium]|nr:MAG: hypothetical protein CR986_10605 [Ignavibacteriota bacterium]
MKKILYFLTIVPTLIFAQILTSFEGIQFNGEKPPDPVIAVGQNHVMLAVNSEYKIYQKDGTFISGQTFSDLFNTITPTPTGYIFDPKLVYDHYSDRFILLALSKTPNNRFLLAVSQTNDPTGNWYKYDFENESLYNVDYPGLGYNKTSIVLTSHSLDHGDGSSYLPEITILDKQEVYNGNISYRKNFVAFPSNPAKIKPARVIGSSSSNNIYLVDTKTASEIRIWSVTNPLGGNNASLNNVKTITLGSYIYPSNAVQKGTTGTGLIDNKLVSSSISDIVIMDDIIYGAYTVRNSTDDGNMIVYFSVDINNNFNLLINETIESANKYYYYPVIHPDRDGNITLVFNKSSLTEYVGIVYTQHKKNNSTHSPIQSLKSGSASYELIHNTRNRWGDYSGIAMDPENNYRIWIYGEWAKTSNQWSTWVGEINTAEIKDFYFTNKYENTNLGGEIIVNNVQVSSGGSTPLETGTHYTAKTNNERFPNWNNTGITYKQNNWNRNREKHLIEYNFEANGNKSHHDAQFNKLLYSKIAITTEGSFQPNDGTLSFQDPWYVKSDGSQSAPQTDIMNLMENMEQPKEVFS